MLFLFNIFIHRSIEYCIFAENMKHILSEFVRTKRISVWKKIYSREFVTYSYIPHSMNFNIKANIDFLRRCFRYILHSTSKFSICLTRFRSFYPLNCTNIFRPINTFQNRCLVLAILSQIRLSPDPLVRSRILGASVRWVPYPGSIPLSSIYAISVIWIFRKIGLLRVIYSLHTHPQIDGDAYTISSFSSA